MSMTGTGVTTDEERSCDLRITDSTDQGRRRMMGVSSIGGTWSMDRVRGWGENAEAWSAVWLLVSVTASADPEREGRCRTELGRIAQDGESARHIQAVDSSWETAQVFGGTGSTAALQHHIRRVYASAAGTQSLSSM
nr:hypothetical protein CFP56_30034 [Quercus suber]